jgi:hypothetical protein
MAVKVLDSSGVSWASSRQTQVDLDRCIFRGAVSSRFRKIQGPFRAQVGGFRRSGTDSRRVFRFSTRPSFGRDSFGVTLLDNGIEASGTRRTHKESLPERSGGCQGRCLRKRFSPVAEAFEHPRGDRTVASSGEKRQVPMRIE